MVVVVVARVVVVAIVVVVVVEAFAGIDVVDDFKKKFSGPDFCFKLLVYPIFTLIFGEN